MRFLMGIIFGVVCIAGALFAADHFKIVQIPKLAIQSSIEVEDTTAAEAATVVEEESPSQEAAVEVVEEVAEVVAQEPAPEIEVITEEAVEAIEVEDVVTEEPAEEIQADEIQVELPVLENPVLENIDVQEVEVPEDLAPEEATLESSEADELPAVVEAATVAPQVTQEVIEEVEGVIVRQGAQMVIDENAPELGHFLSTASGEVVPDELATGALLPENVNLFIAETSKHRLTEDDLENLPSSVILAVWPDSTLVTSSRPFYLLTPPLNILDTYALQNIVNDQDGYYQNTFPASKGIFVRDLTILAESSAFSKAIYAQVADKNKTLVMFSGYVDPKLNEALEETQVDFRRIDYFIEQNHPTVSVETQWEKIMDKARHGEELNILLEADEKGLSDLKAAIKN